MGYSHYWRWNRPIADANTFAAWSRDMQQLVEYLITPGSILPVFLQEALFEAIAQGRPTYPVEIELTYPMTYEPDLEPKALPDGWPRVIHGYGYALSELDLVPKPRPDGWLVVRGPDGIGPPIITPRKVAFNGDLSTDKACEPFIITLEDLEAPHYHPGCKTLRKPYDFLVICALVRLVHYFPAVRVDSDGGEEPFTIGNTICREVFGDNTFHLAAFWDDEDEKEGVQRS